MIAYAASRLMRAVVTLWLLVSLTFLVMRLTGDPALLIMSVEAPPEAIAAFERYWGLDQPLWRQYADYVGGLASADFGFSMRSGQPALDLVADRIPATLALTVPALFLKLLTGIPAGVYAALRRDTLADRLTMASSVVGYAVPSFVLALVLILVFAVLLQWVPSGGADDWRGFVLPIITLALPGAAVIARFARSAMIEVLGQPYVRTATGKGIVWRQVVTRHVLPNAAIPTVTIVGFMVGSLMAGSIIVETVFAWPGVGQLLISAVGNRDLAIVQTVLLFVGLCMVTANLAVDLIYMAGSTPASEAARSKRNGDERSLRRCAAVGRRGRGQAGSGLACRRGGLAPGDGGLGAVCRSAEPA